MPLFNKSNKKQTLGKIKYTYACLEKEIFSLWKNNYYPTLQLHKLDKQSMEWIEVSGLDLDFLLEKKEYSGDLKRRQVSAWYFKSGLPNCAPQILFLSPSLSPFLNLLLSFLGPFCLSSN